MPFWFSFSFQDRISPQIEEIIFFHDHAMMVAIMVSVLSFYCISSFILSRAFDAGKVEAYFLERGWTIAPIVTLLLLGLPSLSLLYKMEERRDLSGTLKVTGHQWYWSYDWLSDRNTGLDVKGKILKSSLFNCLATDKIVTLPVGRLIRSTVTSNDVIHSWALPSLGVKVDSVPGRLRQVIISSKKRGLAVGQCSEICGTNHSFIPIVLLFKL